MNAEFTNLLMLNFAWHHVFTNLCVEQIVNLFNWVNSGNASYIITAQDTWYQKSLTEYIFS